jgi:hypothetical protein
VSDIAKGTLVQHASLGVGKVVAVEPTALHVFFPGSGKRYAAKLRWPDARSLLRTDGVERDSWLEGLSSFLLDPTERRYALATGWITHDQAIAEFLRDFPRGFADPAYLGRNGGAPRARAPHWRAARAAWVESMGGGEGERLLAARDVRKLVDRAVRIEKHVTLVPGTFEAGTLARAFEDPDAALPFFEALFELLAAAPGRARFEGLSVAADALEIEPALAWPMVTLFPFIADPGRHVFLSPRTACAAAKRLGCDLRYDPTPSWATYAALRAFATRLLARFEPAGARDFIDVEAFLHAMASSRASGGRTGPASTRDARPATRIRTKR